MISVPTLVIATGCTQEAADRFAQPLSDAADQWEINTPRRRAYFIAQCAYASKLFTKLDEAADLTFTTTRACMTAFPGKFNTSEQWRPYLKNPEKVASLVYAHRGGNGSAKSGDGWTFRKRGLIPTWGQTDYIAYGTRSGAAVLDFPDLLLDPVFAADSAGWAWWSHDCNRLADGDRLKPIVRALGGTPESYDDRALLTARVLRAFKETLP